MTWEKSVQNGYRMLAMVAIIMASVQIIGVLKFVLLPLLCFFSAFFAYRWRRNFALCLFFFFLPLINSLPDLQFNGYPYNYMGLILFFFSGLVVASLVNGERLHIPETWRGIYGLYLAVLLISLAFLFLRWSNLTLSPLAFLADTPVTPAGKRLSFASVFPVLTFWFAALPPFLPPLLRLNGWNLERALRPIFAGFSISLGIGIYQKYVNAEFLGQGWWRELGQYNGGFSDFNAFGFFAGFLFLFLLLRFMDHRRQWLTHGSMLLLALSGIFISGSRIAFFFVLVGLGFILVTRSLKLLPKVVVLAVIVVVFVLFGGRLKERLQASVRGSAGITDQVKAYQVLNQLSSGRLQLIRDTLPMVKSYPVTGVGVGNYLFYLDFLAYPQPAMNELALNQYLLVLCESGSVGLLLFLLFLWTIWSRLPGGKLKLLAAAMAVAIAFNVYLWFPETVLLFWLVFAAATESETIPTRTVAGKRWLVVAILLIFTGFQVIHFTSLHPQNLCAQKGVPYSYGFWYREQAGNESFHWSRGRSGVYIEKGGVQSLRFVCAAPLASIPGHQQILDLYWRGRHARRLIFNEPGSCEFSIPAKTPGFLEIRIEPVFAPKEMGLNDDARRLGLQVFGLTEENRR